MSDVSAAGDVVFVVGGSTGTVVKRVVTSPSPTLKTLDETGNVLRAVLADSPDRAIAVGENGTVAIIGVDGNGTPTQTQMQIPGVTNLNAIARVDADELIAVGDNGTIVSSLDDGLTWSPVDVGMPIMASLHGVWVQGQRIYVVGDAGTILRRLPDLTWSAMPLTPPARDLFAIHGVADDALVAVGDRTIVQYDGTGWTRIRPPVSSAFRSVVMDPPRIYVGSTEQAFVLYRAGP